MQAGICQAATPSIDKIVAQIQDTYEKMRSLQAEFTQTVRFKDFGTGTTSHGTLYLKPGKMRWSYRKPHQQQIYIIEDVMLHYVPEHRQVMKGTITKGGNQLPLKILRGTGDMRDDFDIKEEARSLPKRPVLRLTPKQADGGYLTVTVAPHAEGALFKEIVLHEPNGNTSTLTFGAVKLNKKVSDDLFQFDVPAGTEVIEMP